MIRSFPKALYLLLVGLVAGAMIVACGTPDECQSTNDCKSKGADYVCDGSSGTKKCVQKADPNKCDPACAADETCNAGKCEKTATGPCGGKTCAADEECQNDACVKKTTPDCQTDADCATDGSKVCKSGKCEDAPTTGCASDAECQNGQKCDTGNKTCVDCLSDTDCATGKTCKSNKCEDAPPTGCTSDADCAAGETCDTTVTPGVCKTAPAGTKEAGEECNNDCKAGHQCINFGQTAGAACMQTCNADADCAANTYRKTCRQFSLSDGNGGTTQQGFCIGFAKKGDKCGYTKVGKNQGPCEGGLTPPLYCSAQDSTCKEAVVQTNEGDPCNKQDDNTEPPKICDNDAGLACDEATGTCKKATIAKEGEECDLSGTNNNGQPILCEKDHLCISFAQDGSRNRCHKTCAADADCPTAKTTCLELLSNGGKICMNDTCTADADCPWSNYTCGTLQSGGKLCLPSEVPGPVPFGGLCKTPTKQFGCNTDANNGGDASLFCLRVTDANGNPAAQGYCSSDCTQSGTCPSYSNSAGTAIPATCVQLNQAGAKGCVFPCGQPGQTCPDGLTCQNIGGQQLCLAP